MLRALPGRAVATAELERFRAEEAAKGNLMKEVGPGTWLVSPAPGADASSPGRTP